MYPNRLNLGFYRYSLCFHKNGWRGGSLLLYVCRSLNHQQCISPSQSQHRLILCSAFCCFTDAEYHSEFSVLWFVDMMPGFGVGELLSANFAVAAKPVSCSLVMQVTTKCVEANLGKVPPPLSNVYGTVC